MTAFIRDIRRLFFKALPLIISLILTSVIFSILINLHQVIGTVSTEITSIWI